MDTEAAAKIADDDERCPLTAALAAVGGKWSLIVLYWLDLEKRRFAELQRLMPGISHKVLTETLRDLERDGLVLREVFAEVPPRVEYSISAHGRTAAAVVEAMRKWGRLHLRWCDTRDNDR
jgi:DNA-binding HxlR family transcriptional regulator